MSDRALLGIDLGTTYSCVASLDEYDRANVLPNSDGELTTPSVVFFEDGGNVVVGKAAKNELGIDPDRVVALIKRHMGEDDYELEYDGQSYRPQHISAIILRSLATAALRELGQDPPSEGELAADAVITVPAYFGAAERQATRDAGTMAGLRVVNIINEPTAAAIAYGTALEGPGERSVLVYDLGGGTFDVTVITVAAETIRVIATDGDHRLGGADWDARIMDLLAEKFMAEHPGTDPRTDVNASGELLVLAENAKKDLSVKAKYKAPVTAHGERAMIEVSREEFEERTADLIDRTMTYTQRIVEAAGGKGITHFDAVLLVGGMSRSPAVTRALTERFPDLPTPRITDPDHIVAKGAVLFAANSALDVDPDQPDPGPNSGSAESGRNGNGGGYLPGPTIINVSSKGYGIKVVDGPRDHVGHVAWLIRPNDEIPAGPTERFQTVSDNQVEVHIEVYESFTSELDDSVTGGTNKELVNGNLTGLPRKPAGQPLTVEFGLGDDGILRVTATAENGRRLDLEARISGATSEEEMARPLPAITY